MNNNEIKSKLIEVKELIEKGWVQGDFATDEDDFPVDPCSTNACSWCLLGAINVVTTETGYFHLIWEIENQLNTAGFIDVTIPVWNDHPHRTKEEVLEILDKTIANV